MARYLITQSLLSSWNYTFNCFEGYEEEAQAEFLQGRISRQVPSVS